MSQEESPCVKICQLSADGSWCLGCGRLRGEIGAWVGLDDGQRRAVKRRAALRLLAAGKG